MAVKVYVPNKVNPQLYAAGDDFEVENGNLVVTGAYSADRGQYVTEAIYAPGTWLRAVRGTDATGGDEQA